MTSGWSFAISALQCRHERLTGTLSDAAPILWQYGALARLKKGEKIDKLLHGGYSTISLGYAGLWECVYSMTGKKLTEPDGEAFGLEIMRKLNEYTCQSGKRRKTSITACMARRWKARRISLPSAYKSGLAS